jgi:tetratricopeptide (TPR) repeat protein
MYDLFYSSTETPATFKNQGNILLGQGRFPEAEGLYRKAIALDSAYMPAHYNLGIALRMQDRPEEALAAFEVAHKLVPGDYEICMNKGVTLIDVERPEEALAAFTRANELMPTAPEPLVNMGFAHERMAVLARGRTGSGQKGASSAQDYLDAAIGLYHRALAINPDIAQAHNNLGFALLLKDRPDEAEESLRRAIALDPNLADAHCNLGDACKTLQRYAEAESSYRKALAINPGYEKANKALGNLLAERGRAD